MKKIFLAIALSISLFKASADEGMWLPMILGEQVYADMQWLQAASKSNRDFLNLLRSPIITSDKKIKILEAIAGEKLSKITGRGCQSILSSIQSP